MDAASSFRERVRASVNPVLGGAALIALAFLVAVPLAFYVGYGVAEMQVWVQNAVLLGVAAFWVGLVYAGSFVAIRGVARAFLPDRSDRDRLLVSIVASFAITAAVVVTAMALVTRAFGVRP